MEQVNVLGFPVFLDTQDARNSDLPFSTFKEVVLKKIPEKFWAGITYKNKVIKFMNIQKFFRYVHGKFPESLRWIKSAHAYLVGPFLSAMKEAQVNALMDLVDGGASEPDAEREEQIADFIEFAQVLTQNPDKSVAEIEAIHNNNTFGPKNAKSRKSEYGERATRYVGGNGRNNLLALMRAAVTRVNQNSESGVVVHLKENLSIEGSPFVEDAVLTCYSLKNGKYVRVGKSLSVQYKPREADEARKRYADKAGLERTWVNVDANNFMRFSLELIPRLTTWKEKAYAAASN